MNSKFNKQNMIAAGKKVLSNLLIIVALVLGFVIGRNSHFFTDKKEVAEDANPYNHVYSPQTISVAVNDANEMLVIDRSTGKYQVYSDSVGIMIFKLYASKIYANQTSK